MCQSNYDIGCKRSRYGDYGLIVVIHGYELQNFCGNGATVFGVDYFFVEGALNPWPIAKLDRLPTEFLLVHWPNLLGWCLDQFLHALTILLLINMYTRERCF